MGTTLEPNSPAGSRASGLKKGLEDNIREVGSGKVPMGRAIKFLNQGTSVASMRVTYKPINATVTDQRHRVGSHSYVHGQDPRRLHPLRENSGMG